MADTTGHVAHQIRARIESPAVVAQRLPSVATVVAVPRLTGWAQKSFAELATRIRGEVIKMVTSRDLLKQNLGSEFRALLDAAPQGQRADITKNWCAEHHNDAVALEVLCEAQDAVLDNAVVSLVLTSSAEFDNVGRSRVLSVLAARVLEWPEPLHAPDSASRLLLAVRDLTWESPAHEAIALALMKLETEVSYEATPEERDKIDDVLGVPVSGLVEEYVHHPRVAVAEKIARRCERPDLLKLIGERALSVHAIDPRMTYRLVAALAENPSTPAEVLHPFARPELWTQGESEQLALGALLNRSLKVPQIQGLSEAYSTP